MAQSPRESSEVIVNSTALARGIVRQLIEAGATQFVLSPGSRNSPISLALFQAQKRGIVELFVRIDERSAGFFALGLAKSSGKYVGVVCTSGTAVANFHPGALEAYHSQEKLIFLTADRPARLRETGANQTTLQNGLLHPLTVIDTDHEVTLEKYLQGAPLHLNLQFDDPLIESDETDWLAGVQLRENVKVIAEPRELAVAPRSIIIVGHDRAGIEAQDIINFAAKAQLPLIAEDPLTFPDSIAHASIALTDSDVRKRFMADQIIVIGRTTLSRSINTYIAECKSIIVVDPRAETIDTKRKAEIVLYSLPKLKIVHDPEWSHLWKRLQKAKLTVTHWGEQSAIQAITRNLPDGSALFVASSRPIRDVEGFAEPRSGLTVFANRGLAGIDGNISTTLGIAANYHQTTAIIGDITFLHDFSALADTHALSARIFIIDNNGGGIFSTLPGSEVDGFETVFGTPHNLDLAKLISGFGIGVVKVKTETDIAHICKRASIGIEIVIVEVPTRVQNAENLKEISQSFVSAFLTGANLA